MVKKKKNRHQQEPVTQNGGDSTESCDENNSGGKSCSHANKAVDLTKVKKALKLVGLARTCLECSKAAAEEDEDLSFWLCLKCGYQACKQHSQKHYHTPRSEQHSIALNTQVWNTWCYDCDLEIAAQCRKKLHECVEFIKRQEEAPPISKNGNSGNVPEKNGVKVPAEASTLLKNGKAATVPNNLPRLRGLCNVGNTCFFNAVVQCLAQTPFLLPVLEEMRDSGTKFKLAGHPAEDDKYLPILEGELGKWGNLTEILASTLVELQSSKCEVYNPSRLLNKLIQRCPQFGGGEQHDSHELLRHLLEGVRTEDLKRYQSAILHMLGLSEKSNPSQVEDDIRAKAKAYGRQANEMMLHPEQVFRGFLVSTLECQDCMHSSQRVESFLDLSLPVMADKPQPPVVRRKVNNDESYDVCGNASGGQPSKHQLKKERKQARKERKRHKGEQPAIVEENTNTAVKNPVESEQSDADVEDNVEQDASAKTQMVDVGESGYSSEKLGNEDSAVESPVSHLGNGDSALASPAELRRSTSPWSLCNGDVSEASKELVVAIPASVESSLSNQETPSPVSSEVNIDCSSSVSAHVSPDCNRPVSRFAFFEDVGISRFSMMEDLYDDMSHLSVEYYENPCRAFVLVNKDKPVEQNGYTSGCELQPMNRTKDVDVDVEASCDVLFGETNEDRSRKLMCGGGLVESAGGRGDQKEQIVCDGGTSKSKTQSNGEVANWSATLSPRYQCDDGECSIQSCLNQFTALELMTGNNKVGCENCTQRHNQGKEGKMICTNSTKQLLVKSPPAVLILHLKRFQVHRAMFRKMSRHVNFPLVLDIAPICSAMYKDSLKLNPGQNKVLYSLYGVVEHSGTLHGGHYVAYVKVRAPLKSDDPRWLFLPPDPQGPRQGMERKEEESIAAGGATEAPPGKWYFVSDSRVNEVGEERVLRSQAYLLFYERIW